VRRDMHGKQVDNWVPTWWGPNQLTYLPGVREYLREQAIRADKNSLDLNVLAHLGPQNLEEAWAYFKHWVKGRPVGPEVCLNDDAKLDPNNTMLPNRAGPIHMQHDTKLHPDRPYNPNPPLPAWPYGSGGGRGGRFGFGLGGPPPRAPPPSDDDSDDDGGFGALVPAAKNVTPEGMYRGRAEGGREYFFGPSGSEWAAVNAAADRALDEVTPSVPRSRLVRSSTDNPSRPLAIASRPSAGPPMAPSEIEAAWAALDDRASSPGDLISFSPPAAVNDQLRTLLSDEIRGIGGGDPDDDNPLGFDPDTINYATEDEVGYESDEVGVPVSQSPIAPQPSPPLVYSPTPRGTPWPAITPPPSRSLGPMAPAYNPTFRPRSENPLASRYRPSPVRGFGSLVTNEVAKRFRNRRNSAVAISEMV
jgi:hypothetical protein